MKSIRIATRKSPLAMWQANDVSTRLRRAHKGLEVEIVGLMTEGDRLLNERLAAKGGKGLFLKELEASLLRNETDIAVHSMKDVPVKLPAGLTMAAFCTREDARDAFVSNNFNNLYALPKGSRIGTASLRRTAQLKNAFPALEFIELRGNVNTRLAKLDGGEFDAIILAAAGLIRLDLAPRIKQYIPTELCLPAVGQGIMGIECRSDDSEIIKLLAPLNDPETQLCLTAERALNEALDGGCHVPIAGYAHIENKRIVLRGLVGEPDGTRVVVSQSEKSLEPLLSEDPSPSDHYLAHLDLAKSMGNSVAQNLFKQGAGEILEALFGNEPQPEKLVVLTRQSDFLGNMESILKALDYSPTHVPTIKIDPFQSPRSTQLLEHLHSFSDIVFVSRNAVNLGMKSINEFGGIPPHVRVMAVGAESAKQLYRLGIDALFPQTGSGAEALLNVAQLADLSERNILLVRGEDGLDWPAQEMRNRGAVVEEFVCYSQSVPPNTEAALQNLASQGNHVVAVFFHNANSVKNLAPLADSQYPQMLDAVAIAGSERIADTLAEVGWRGRVVVAESPSNKHMMISFSKRNKEAAVTA